MITAQICWKILRVCTENIKFSFDFEFIVWVEHFIIYARVIYSHAVGSYHKEMITKVTQMSNSILRHQGFRLFQ